MRVEVSAVGPYRRLMQTIKSIFAKCPSAVCGGGVCLGAGPQERLGFGRYQFQTVGRVDHLDENVVLGLFIKYEP